MDYKMYIKNHMFLTDLQIHMFILAENINNYTENSHGMSKDPNTPNIVENKFTIGGLRITKFKRKSNQNV